MPAGEIQVDHWFVNRKMEAGSNMALQALLLLTVNITQDLHQCINIEIG